MSNNTGTDIFLKYLMSSAFVNTYVIILYKCNHSIYISDSSDVFCCSSHWYLLKDVNTKLFSLYACGICIGNMHTNLRYVLDVQWTSKFDSPTTSHKFLVYLEKCINMGDFKVIAIVLGLTTIGLLAATIALGVQNSKSPSVTPVMTEMEPEVVTETVADPEMEKLAAMLTMKGKIDSENPCVGKKPDSVPFFDNQACLIDGVVSVLEQAGANVTAGYKGNLEATDRPPITDPYWKTDLCPVNVHWHLGAEHLSVGEFDENGMGPAKDERKLATEEVRQGFQCHHYDADDAKFTAPYDWKFCKDMEVGQTYEIHWPHSAAGACGTPFQYQSPFYDGVFCTDGILSLDPLNTYFKIGVQGQVFTIVNDEDFYYPDLIKGMIVDGEMGKDITKYTGSTTGTSRNNDICSKYTPVTWQVDRKCHMISASSFDKLCADMLTQVDDMESDTHAHGARELVADHLAANNHQNFRY